MSRITITPLETVKGGELLKLHLVPLGDALEPGNYRYEQDWDDGRVAKELGGRLSVDHIQRLRLALGYKIEPTKTGGTVSYRDPRVSLLVERFNGLLDLLVPDVVGSGLAARGEIEALKITVADLKETSL